MDLNDSTLFYLRIIGFVTSAILLFESTETNKDIDTGTGICGITLAIVVTAVVFLSLFSYRDNVKDE